MQRLTIILLVVSCIPLLYFMALCLYKVASAGIQRKDAVDASEGTDNFLNLGMLQYYLEVCVHSQ